MKIICTKDEYADLMANCQIIKDCRDCILYEACRGVIELNEMIEIKEAENDCQQRTA